MKVLLGLDAGGTHTRVLVVDTHGIVLGRHVGSGSNPEHGPGARDNAHAAIREALRIAGCAPADVAGIVIGQAGLNNADDQQWAATHSALPDICCPRLHVNDSVVAHVGALRSQPGIIAISGSGSIVFGITESGDHVRNYDFDHYAPSAAAHLGMGTIEQLADPYQLQSQDESFVGFICAHWSAGDLDALRQLAERDFDMDGPQRLQQLGRMAPLVTSAAHQGSPLAQSVCQTAAQALCEGIRLVGSRFSSPTVRTALIGSVVRSDYMSRTVGDLLAHEADPGFTICEPECSPEIGAAIMALEAFGTTVDQGVIDNLTQA